jgi:methyl-accepting chemotaxis protein
MATGASDQAAAAEEASASLTQMAATSKSTSELTIGAGNLMSENIKKSVRTVQIFIELTEKVKLIVNDSDRISQIIRSIEEIAFQTKLLALNAAIEAARAGGSGSGFAIVAQEVRELARKTEESAKTTQQLLEVTIQRVSESAESINEMNDDFEGIIRTATNMGDKTNAITEASKELALNIDYISQGVNEMDRVAQENAANAEEFAGSSEQLSSEAQRLKQHIKELTVIVGETYNHHFNS